MAATSNERMTELMPAESFDSAKQEARIQP